MIKLVDQEDLRVRKEREGKLALEEKKSFLRADQLKKPPCITIFFKKLCTYLQIDFSGRPFPFPHLVFHCALSGDVELEDRHEGAQGPGQELSGRT